MNLLIASWKLQVKIFLSVISKDLDQIQVVLNWLFSSVLKWWDKMEHFSVTNWYKIMKISTKNFFKGAWCLKAMGFNYHLHHYHYHNCNELNVCVPPKFIVWNPNPQSDGIRWWSLRSWGWSLQEWGECPYKRDLRELHHSCLVGTQQEDPVLAVNQDACSQLTSNLLAPWS